jgi:hypothetical protein
MLGAWVGTCDAGAELLVVDAAFDAVPCGLEIAGSTEAVAADALPAAGSSLNASCWVDESRLEDRGGGEGGGFEVVESAAGDLTAAKAEVS